MWLEGFWSLFATQTLEFGGLTLLQNPNLPLLEVNCAYGQLETSLKMLPDAWQPPRLWLSSETAQGLLQYKGLMLEWGTGYPANMIIEQVAWTQAPVLARVWCQQHQALEWQDSVANEIARVMQQYPELCAYLAYEADAPTGMLLAMPKTGWWHNGTPKQWFSSQLQGAVSAWWAGKNQIAKALFARAKADFGGLEVSVPTDFEARAKVVQNYQIFLLE